jgi:hypothetical protein
MKKDKIFNFQVNMTLLTLIHTLRLYFFFQITLLTLIF